MRVKYTKDQLDHMFFGKLCDLARELGIKNEFSIQEQIVRTNSKNYFKSSKYPYHYPYI